MTSSSNTPDYNMSDVENTHTPAWKGTTYGNGWMHRWLIRLLRYVLPTRLLYAFVAIFVVPVCLIVNPAQRVTYRYFRQQWCLSRWKAVWKTYHNFFLFAQVVIDKFAMYAGKHFNIKVEGYQHFLHLVEADNGFVQLSAHIGNYEIAGYTLVAERKRLNALVFGGEKESVMANRSRMFAGTNISMISIRQDMSHMFRINEALAEGEIVSMPADRLLGSKKSIRLKFLRGKAEFPQGPFSISTMRGLDVLAVNVMKTAPKEYTIYCTPLAYDKTADRKEQIRQLATAYVAELERMLSKYPEQWYNYFEFWTEKGISVESNSI